jgi:hypothetical protein
MGVGPVTKKAPDVSLRVKVSLALFERIGEYRHLGRHESRQQALVCLLTAGLAALSKPVTLPSSEAQKRTATVSGASEARQ